MNQQFAFRSTSGAASGVTALALLALIACGKAGDNASPGASSHSKASAAASAAEQVTQHLKLGREAYGKRGDYAAALTSFEPASAVAADDATVLNEVALAALMTGDYGKAETAAKRALDVAADNKLKGAASYNLGRLAQVRGRLQEAASYYLQSLQLRPDNATVMAFHDDVMQPAPPCEGKLQPTKAALCECLVEGATVGACEPSHVKLPLGEIWSAEHPEYTRTYLVSRESGGFRPILDLGEPATVGDQFITGKVSKAGGKSYLAVELKSESRMGGDEYLEEEVVMLCQAPLATCTVVLKTASHATNVTDNKPSPEASWATAYKLDDAGIVTVSRTKGKPPAAVLTTQRLW
ncbi:MAG: tetratricopeptide repeat protein [Myxococcales bacterium]|nr:tetratricopeptide repeat protein [Myxococcales bacterium]